MKKKQVLGLFAILLVAVFAISCCFLFACKKDKETVDESEEDFEESAGDTGSTDATVVSVSVTADNYTIEVGGTATLTASVTMSSGTYSGSYVWSSSDEKIATVEGSTSLLTRTRATVTGVAEGDATITVTLDNRETASCDITVEAAPTTNSERFALASDEAKIGDVSFANAAGISYTLVGVTYTLTGETASMTKAQATAFNGENENGEAQEGDPYVVYAIKTEPGEILSGVKSGTWTNTNTATEENDGTEDYAFIIRLSACEPVTYTLTTADETVYTYTVAFDVVLPEYGRIVLSHQDAVLNDVAFDSDPNLTIVENSSSGSYVLTGPASIMTREQADAWNNGYTGEGAVTAGTRYVVYAILVHPGESISGFKDGSTVTNSSDVDDYCVFIVEVTGSGNSKEYTITNEGETETITVSFDGVIIDEIGGIWSAKSVTASVEFGESTYDNVTASIELNVNLDGTLTLTISNIVTGMGTILGFDVDALLAGVDVQLTGTWTSSETAGSYTMKIEGGSGDGSTVTLENETLKISFSTTYTIMFVISLEITVTDAELATGSLADNASVATVE